MTIDVDALLAETAEPRKKCNVCMFLDSRPADERAKWQAALEQPLTFSNKHMSRALSRVKKDSEISDHSVRTHRMKHMKRSS